MKNYKADDFTWQVPNIDPTTPHNQIPYAQLFDAAMERHLTNFWGFTPAEAISSITAQAAQFERPADGLSSVEPEVARHVDAGRKWRDAGSEFSGKEYRDFLPDKPPTP